MSDVTTPTETETKAPKTKKVIPQQKVVLNINGRDVPAIVTEHAKGPAKGKEVILLDLPLDNEAAWNNLRDLVGAENFYRKLFVEVIRDICNDASSAARGDDGKVDDTQYLHEIEQEFLPTSRASGPSKKDLEKERGVILAELLPYYKKFMDKSITDEENLQFLQLVSKAEELNEAIEKKLRKTKAPAPVPTPAN